MQSALHDTSFVDAACLKAVKRGKYHIEPVFAIKAIRLRFKTLFIQAARLRIVVTGATLVCGALVFLYFGGYALVATDPLPQHADVAVMLAGGINSEEARMAEAIRLLQEGRVDHVMLSIGGAFFLGEWLPDLLLRYVRKEYGAEVAGNVVACELSDDVNSTSGEVLTVRRCLEARGWRSVIVVTSNYHTRRARWIWRAALAKAEPPFMLSVRGVSDGDFEPDGWWRQRRYAKTWLLEFTKLVWSHVFG